MAIINVFSKDFTKTKDDKPSAKVNSDNEGFIGESTTSTMTAVVNAYIIGELV